MWRYWIVLSCWISGHSQANFELGQLYFEKKDYTKARPYLEKHVKEFQDDFVAIEILGDLYAHTKVWDRAAEEYFKLKESNKSDANYHYKYAAALAMYAQKTSKWKAISLVSPIRENLEKAIELDPQHIDAYWALIMFYLKVPTLFGGDENKALKYANKLLEYSKVDGFLAKGRIEQLAKRYTSAEREYIKAHEIGNSSTTFQALYSLYKNDIKDEIKAMKLKSSFELKN